MTDEEKRTMDERIALFRQMNELSDVLNNAARAVVYGTSKRAIEMELIQVRELIDRLLNERASDERG